MSDEGLITGVGGIGVFEKNPPNGNPRLGTQLLGKERHMALLKFKNEGEVEGLDFWFMPSTGRPHIVVREDIDWDTTGV